MKIMSSIKEKIEASGRPGSTERINCIARLSPEDYPEEAIEAAKRVSYKRSRRLELSEMGFSRDQISVMVESEFKISP